MKGDGREWIPELVRLEFLVGLNATKVVNGKFKDAFRSILVTPEPGKLLGISPRKDWPKRLGASYLNQLRRQVRQDRARKDDRAMEPLGTFPGPSTGEPP